MYRSWLRPIGGICKVCRLEVASRVVRLPPRLRMRGFPLPRQARRHAVPVRGLLGALERVALIDGLGARLQLLCLSAAIDLSEEGRIVA